MADSPLVPGRNAWNAARWPVGEGHYEGWFIRANHPTRPLAFWIRYTIFAPALDPERAEGELWAVWFDGERASNLAVRSAYPVAGCRFSRERLDAQIARASLTDDGASGAVEHDGRRIGWTLSFREGGPPLLLMPRSSYSRRFPKAKALVARPACRFDGSLTVDGDVVAIDGWLGSQNHNWGPAHTDRYAWGQVAGFDDREDAFLECSSARLRIGPMPTPWLTAAVLRMGGEEIAFNSIVRSPLARVRLDATGWTFNAATGSARLRVAFTESPDRFVRLEYRNPPGGAKTCLNSKIASCEVSLQRHGRPTVSLRTKSRAAFELLDLPGSSPGGRRDHR